MQTRSLATSFSRRAHGVRRRLPDPLQERAASAWYRVQPAGMRLASFAERCRRDAEFCGALGSPLYSQLLRVVADDIDAGGPCRDVLAHRPPGGRYAAASARAFMAAVHRIVLETPDTALAPYYPSVGGEVDLERVPAAFLEVVADHRARLVDLVLAPVQTNEVTRSQALLGGFLVAAQETGLPLRILELGASAGLNLRWDQYRYSADGQEWGDPSSPVHLGGGFAGAAPPMHVDATVAQRRGCDLNPLDAATREGQLSLLCQVWADHTERLALLRAALDVATRVPVQIDRADAGDWIEAQLAEPAPGLTTVVFDTGVMEYLRPADRERIQRTIEHAGIRAGANAPVGWLRARPSEGASGELQFTLWPGGRPRRLALLDDLWARKVEWLEPAAVST